MLNLILGRAGSGKTVYARNLLCEKAKKGETGLYLLVPDQYSFESERAMLALAGTSASPAIEVLGFSRLCDTAFRQYGGAARERLDECGRAVIMRRAVHECADSLKLYRRCASSDAFTLNLLSAVTEFKRSCVMPDDLLSASARVGDTALGEKLSELALIMSAYNALTDEAAADPEDDLALLYGKLSENSFFNEKTVVIDSFKGFTGQQLKIIGLICAQAREVYITLPCNSLSDAENPAGLFANVARTAQRLISIAQRNSVACAPPVLLGEPRRFRSSSIAAAERGIYRSDTAPKQKNDGSIEIYHSANQLSEADFAARKIVSLLRDEGYRCREIAVIARDDARCKRVADAFERYGIPCFSDRRVSLKYYPVVRFCSHTLDFLSGAVGTGENSSDAGRQSDGILVQKKRAASAGLFRALKTGMCGIDFNELTAAENYMELWKLSADWLSKEWTFDPAGFDATRDAEKKKELLGKLNETRRSVYNLVWPLVLSMRKAKTGADRSRALYEFLIACGADSALRKEAAEATGAGKSREGELLSSSWDALMTVLDQLAQSLTGETTLGEYDEMFRLCVCAASFGTIPQGIDEVSVGTADRMRPASPRAVLILGANEGVFPATSAGGGILSPGEREKMIRCGIEINDCALSDIVEERFLAYTALSAACDRVIISYCSSDSDGQPSFASSLVTELLRVVDGIGDSSAEQGLSREACLDVSAVREISAVLPTMENFGSEIAGKTGFGVALSHALERTGYREAFDYAFGEGNNLFQAISESTASRLYGRDLLISPSAAEKFFTCPFKYFCSYGMKIGAPPTTDIDNRQRGTVMHYVLERIISDRGSRAFVAMTTEEMRKETDRLLSDFLDERLSGKTGKTASFLHNYYSITDTLVNVERNIADEMGQGSFDTRCCEMKIGTDAPAKPMCIALPNGGTLGIVGTVDRVDSYECDGKTYVRIVDYKSSKKILYPQDVACGLNLQMLIYLFTMKRNSAVFNNTDVVPSAVIYTPMVNTVVKLEGGESDEEIADSRRKEMQMQGIILDDGTVASAFGARATEFFKTTGGKANPKLETCGQETLDAIEAYTAYMLRKMGSEIKSGTIQASPLDSKKQDGCKYCEFVAACPNPPGTEHRKVDDSLEFDDFIALAEITEAQKDE